MDRSSAVSSGEGRGRFVVFEGIDGCGKTTQCELFCRWLPGSGLLAAGSQVILTREPGGTPLGNALRQLLLDPNKSVSPCRTSELLLYAADRAQHVDALVRPALAAGDWVISDRFTGSTLAYQGFGRGLSCGLIEDLEKMATAGLRADLTLWLDLPVQLSQQRRRSRHADRIESSRDVNGEPFLSRVSKGFASLVDQFGWQRVDASLPVDQVAAHCQRLAIEWLATGLDEGGGGDD